MCVPCGCGEGFDDHGNDDSSSNQTAVVVQRSESQDDTRGKDEP
jgi:hypothetical protein